MRGGARIAADNAVVAKDPDIAEPRDRRRSAFRIPDLVILVLGRILFASLDKAVDLGRRETGDREVEGQIRRQINLEEPVELQGEQLRVPASEFGEAVVRNPQRGLLRFGEMTGSHHRHCRVAKLLGSSKAAMPSYDLAVATDD
jgi:hypothetical protein